MSSLNAPSVPPSPTGLVRTHSGMLTQESIEAKLSALVDEGTLHAFKPARLDPGDLLRRRVFVTGLLFEWLHTPAELKLMFPDWPAHRVHGHLEAKPYDTQAVLKGYICQLAPSICSGRTCKADLKLLDTGHLPISEVFEVRTFSPDSIRLFGFVPLGGVLVLTHAKPRRYFSDPRTEKLRRRRWDEEIRRADTYRSQMGLPTYAASYIEQYC